MTGRSTTRGRTEHAPADGAAEGPRRRWLPDDSYAPPRDAFEFHLLGAASEVLGVFPIGIRDDLTEVGMDSSSADLICAAATRRLGRSCSPADLADAGDVEQAAIALRDRQWSGAFDCLVPIQPHGDGMPLIAFHPVGGHVTSYTNLARALGPTRPMFGVQAWGLELEAEPHTSISEMATHYANIVESRFPTPAALTGWSFGGVLAFEVARELERRRRQTPLLVVLDLSANDPGVLPAPDQVALPLLIHAFRLHKQMDELVALGVDDALVEIHERSVANGKLPADFGVPRLARMLQLNIVNLRALMRYEFGGYGGRVTVVRAAERADYLSADVDDPRLGWGPYAADVKVIHTHGGHFDFLGRENLPMVAEALREELTSARVGSG